MEPWLRSCLSTTLFGALFAGHVRAEEASDLAKKLSNPVAAMISVPFQFNYDQNIGPLDDGHRTYMNLQPVVPVPIGNDWNMISRTILPVIDQSEIAPGGGHQFGLGDITQSLFFSPTKPTSG